MVEAFIFLLNLLVIPAVSTLCIYLNKKEEDKLFARWILLYIEHIIMIFFECHCIFIKLFV